MSRHPVLHRGRPHLSQLTLGMPTKPIHFSPTSRIRRARSPRWLRLRDDVEEPSLPEANPWRLASEEGELRVTIVAVFSVPGVSREASAHQCPQAGGYPLGIHSLLYLATLPILHLSVRPLP